MRAEHRWAYAVFISGWKIAGQDRAIWAFLLSHWNIQRKNSALKGPFLLKYSSQVTSNGNFHGKILWQEKLKRKFKSQVFISLLKNYVKAKKQKTDRNSVCMPSPEKETAASSGDIQGPHCTITSHLCTAILCVGCELQMPNYLYMLPVSSSFLAYAAQTGMCPLDLYILVSSLPQLCPISVLSLIMVHAACFRNALLLPAVIYEQIPHPLEIFLDEPAVGRSEVCLLLSVY